MKRIFLCCLTMALSSMLYAQDADEPVDTTWKKLYRESYPRTNDLVHTKLDVRFDYDKSYMYGKEWLTLQPHFYPTDSVLLDAKGMELNEVAIMKGSVKTPLKYTYDGMMLNIRLDKIYKGGEKYTLYFDYVSKPNELKSQGSAAITDAKGLYFINPKGEEKNKATQIWTQGETEANSAWMITIDKPNQKTTEEISMTVPGKYVTLSNGLLTSQKKNADGTRTDTWKMDLPHAPYLFFMGVGDYAIIKDSYKGKEVSYYVEKEYAPNARGIFGHTPEMIKFFSDRLGVEYAWPKYAQIVGRDYVSGAMENTTATLHQESAYQNNRQLTDGNGWENVIAHELFHQWFGDLVTAESWSNLSVNESFATLGSQLWNEYKYGKDFGDEERATSVAQYIGSQSDSKDLIRFYYHDKEDMFDAVSYNKGGGILQMLRNYVGDDAFFKSLNNYLTTNRFKAGEAGQLRLAFEEVTGKDMNWFFNQWYYGSGHPKLNISYNYNDAAGKAQVIVEQKQAGKIFKLPIAVDIYNGTDKKRYNVWLQNKIDTLTFSYAKHPDLINVDADKILVAEKTDNKTEENFVHQWKVAKNYVDRKEALDFFSKKSMPELAKGLYDRFAPLRTSTIQKISVSPYKADPVVLAQIEEIAKNDKDKKARAAAIFYLTKNGNAKYLPIFQSAINDSSYSVAGQALKGIAALDPSNAYTLAKKYSTDAKGTLASATSEIIISKGSESDFDFIATKYQEAPPSQEKLALSEKFGDYLSKISNIANIKTGIDYIMQFRKLIPQQFSSFTEPTFKKVFDKLSKEKGKEIEDYIKAGMK